MGQGKVLQGNTKARGSSHVSLILVAGTTLSFPLFRNTQPNVEVYASINSNKSLGEKISRIY